MVPYQMLTVPIKLRKCAATISTSSPNSQLRHTSEMIAFVIIAAVMATASAQDLRNVTCECSFFAAATLGEREVRSQYSAKTIEVTECTNVENDCKVWCASAHDSWWTSNTLTTATPEDDGFGTTYGDSMCVAYDQEIDSTGAGQPIYTKFQATECRVQWTRTSPTQQGSTNLCCNRVIPVTGQLRYRACEL